LSQNGYGRRITLPFHLQDGSGILQEDRCIAARYDLCEVKGRDCRAISGQCREYEGAFFNGDGIFLLQDFL
jgi:hypothetical protein